MTAEFWCGKEGGPAKSSAEIVTQPAASTITGRRYKQTGRRTGTARTEKGIP
jgi:hypothetical protein